MAPDDRSAEVSTIVLAGGASSRFGRDKAMAIVPGTRQTMLDTAIELGHELGGFVFVSGPGRSSPAGDVRWVSDDDPGAGPLGGIVTVLRQVQSPLTVVLAVDQPWLDAQMLAALVDQARLSNVVAAYTLDAHLQPLPCAFPTCSSGQVLTAAWLAGERSLRAAFDLAGLKTFPLDMSSAKLMRDVDRPADLDDA